MGILDKTSASFFKKTNKQTYKQYWKEKILEIPFKFGENIFYAIIYGIISLWYSELKIRQFPHLLTFNIRPMSLCTKDNFVKIITIMAQFRNFQKLIVALSDMDYSN